MSVIDVFATNYTVIDWELQELWIKGLSTSETVTVMRERGVLNEYPGLTQDLLVSDINDNFRLFSMLEQTLLSVGKLSEQLLHQMDAKTQTKFLESYYSLDPVLARELVGKKLSSRLRKDLEEVAEKTGVHLKSCRRQFDNIKRVFKAMEDAPGECVANIEKSFGISRQLAEQYATLVFIVTFRFELNKKKLNYLSFSAIKAVSLRIMENWLENDDDNEPALDKDFFMLLKDLKVLLDKDKEHRALVCTSLKDRVSPKCLSEVESNFKTITRNVVNVAQSLVSSKEAKDFFIYLVEKFVDPLKQMQLDKNEVKIVLLTYSECLNESPLGLDNSVKIILDKYMLTLVPCILAVL
ncbi:acidic fibroblast growth factor intracellular-binding protein-like [Tigriopus californicus]|uniref:acidic fibroblast growth factor intracellular-binding protein-like n=1 Tax=Tigriopus californicus TaxID=6832 RepID=UPI0027DA8C08|nr:acidic fibroblast growth factor intracellular-binding protein-like [Tigriopus californicus]